jgi:hypothetical protein
MACRAFAVASSRRTSGTGALGGVGNDKSASHRRHSAKTNAEAAGEAVDEGSVSRGPRRRSWFGRARDTSHSN